MERYHATSVQSCRSRRAGRWLPPPLSSASTALFPPPALRERRHRGLARCGVAMGRLAILVMPEGQCPHPRHSDGRGVNLEDAADNAAVRQHVVILIVPLARRTRGPCALQDQVGHRPSPLPPPASRPALRAAPPSDPEKVANSCST